MNATQQQYGGAPTHHGYVDSHHATPSTAGPPYSHYGVQVQPPMLPPAVSSYGHGYYSYGSPATGPTSHFSQPMSLSSMTSAPSATAPAPPSYESRAMDTTGQIPPLGMKPKITATLWEDEGTLCFQVEVDGICVARRADNCMINGTKLLNVARMTRGRRDGILKSEKHRKVIKIGPMHLKGVWIPFERALEFANKEKITEQLYPLFVHNVEHHLHQTQLQQGATALANRRGDSRDIYGRTSASQTPAIAQGSVIQSPASIAPGSGRPGLDRAHTIPTPPTSASAIGMGSSGGSYEWASHNMPSHAVSVEGSLNNPKSLPTTPASTPPDNVHIQYSTTQPSYDSRPVYSAPPSHHSPYNIPYSYGKSDMAPPMRTNTAPEPIITKEEDEVNSSPSYTSERGGYILQPHANVPTQDQAHGPSTAEGYKGSPASGRATPRILGPYTTPQHNRGPPLASGTYPMGPSQTPQSYYASNTDKKRLREADEEDSYAKENDAKRQKSIHDSGIGSHRSTPLSIGRPQPMVQRH